MNPWAIFGLLGLALIVVLFLLIVGIIPLTPETVAGFPAVLRGPLANLAEIQEVIAPYWETITGGNDPADVAGDPPGPGAPDDPIDNREGPGEATEDYCNFESFPVVSSALFLEGDDGIFRFHVRLRSDLGFPFFLGGFSFQEIYENHTLGDFQAEASFYTSEAEDTIQTHTVSDVPFLVPESHITPEWVEYEITVDGCPEPLYTWPIEVPPHPNTGIQYVAHDVCVFEAPPYLIATSYDEWDDGILRYHVRLRSDLGFPYFLGGFSLPEALNIRHTLDDFEISQTGHTGEAGDTIQTYTLSDVSFVVPESHNSPEYFDYVITVDGCAEPLFTLPIEVPPHPDSVPEPTAIPPTPSRDAWGCWIGDAHDGHGNCCTPDNYLSEWDSCDNPYLPWQ